MSQPNTEPKARRGFSLGKVCKCLLIVLLVFSLSSMLLSAVMFRVLFPRSSGITAYRYTYAEIDPNVYPRESFKFRSGNCILSACRYPVEDAKGCIVVVNGIGAGIDAHLPEILYFLDHGWSVVTWDATGVGDSEGRGIIGLQQIRQDLLAYLAYRETQPDDGLPLVLYGHSAGAYAAATALDEDYPVAAAVCICGFDSPVSVLYYHARARVGVLADVEYPFLQLECRFLFGRDADLSACTAIDRSETPVFLIESSSDDYVPHELGLLQTDGVFANPNVQSLTVDANWRNEHNTPWLSDESAAYVEALGPDDPVEKARANELDASFMNQILAFYTAAVQVE